MPRLALVAAAVWVVVLLRRVGVDAVLDAVGRVGWGVLVLMVLPAVGLAIHTFGWAVLLPAHARPGAAKAFSVYVASQAGNEIGAGVLGEPLKILASGRKWRAEAAAVLLVDNAVAFVSTLGFGALALHLCGIPALDIPWTSLGSILVLASITIVVAVVARRVGPRLWASLRSEALRVRDALGQILRRSWPRVVTSFVAHALGKAWIIAEFAVALAFVGGVPVSQAWLLGPASVLANIVGAPIPGRLGVLEASALWVADGHAAWFPALLAVVLLRRVRTLCWGALGLYLTGRIVRSADGAGS